LFVLIEVDLLVEVVVEAVEVGEEAQLRPLVRAG